MSRPMRLQILEHVRQYFWPVGVPLLFGGCTCLIVLPMIVFKQSAIPPSALWLGLIVVAIIAIAVAQGFALYKAGANTNFWALGAIGGFALFVLLGCFVIFGWLPGLILLVLLVLAALFVWKCCLQTVPHGYVGLVSSLGKYRRMLYPGRDIVWPWEKVTRVDVREKFWECPAQRVQISPPTKDVIIRASISYQLMPEGARLTVTEVQDWEEDLRRMFQELVRSVASTFSLNDVIVWERRLHAPLSTESSIESIEQWGRVNASLFSQIEERVLPWCVQVNWVRIQDVTLVPHQAPIVDAEVVDAQVVNTPVPAPDFRTTMPSGTTQTRYNGPSPEELEKASKWVQSTKEDVLEKVLEKAYQAVSDEKVVVPEAIRDLANKFTAVARDPQKSKLFKYDAERAARNLYKLAQEYEDEQEMAAASNANVPSSFYNDTTATMLRPDDA